MWEAIAIIILVAGFLSWLLVRRKGQLTFWNRALREPDLTYDFFKSSDVWRVFDEVLPANFREDVPAAEWVGPFPMVVPKLDQRKVLVFGRRSEFRQSQEALLNLLERS